MNHPKTSSQCRLRPLWADARRKGRRAIIRRGSQVAEFAMVIPVVFVIILGGIELTRLFLLRHLAGNASYEATRDVIVPGATAEDAITKANSILSIVGVTGATVTVNPNPILETTTSVSVTVSFPTNGNLWSAAVFSNGMNLSSTTSLLTERGPAAQATAVAQQAAATSSSSASPSTPTSSSTTSSSSSPATSAPSTTSKSSTTSSTRPSTATTSPLSTSTSTTSTPSTTTTSSSSSSPGL